MVTRIDASDGRAAVATVSETPIEEVGRGTLALAVRYMLQCIADTAPGGTVELRIPPFGATQCIAGTNHRRGTPPNVVEMPPTTFLSLALGELSWSDALNSHQIESSGSHAHEIQSLFPVKGV